MAICLYILDTEGGEDREIHHRCGSVGGLRSGVIAITEQPNKGPELKLTKDDWSKLIVGDKTFASLRSDLIAIDQALGR